jgi:predicted phosphodiesterase
MPTKKSSIVLEAVRRFPNLPSRTLAAHILNTHGALFDNDLEKIRTRVRYFRGAHGEDNRKDAHNYQELFKDKPVKLPETWRKKRTSYSLSPGVWLILSDAHIPFHEQSPLEAAVQAGQAEKVDGILLNGDWQDCAALSFWPTAHRDFNREIELVIDSLDWLRQEFPTQKVIYKPGNHEFRMPRYFVKHAPHLAESPVAAMETVLGFEERSIEFLDYYQIVQAGKLPIIHGHEVPAIIRAVNPARGLFLRTKTFSACSHCHSTSEHSPANIHGELLTTWSFGCLCSLSPDYAPYGNDWNWGFAFINVEKDGNFEVINRRILPNGKVV